MGRASRARATRTPRRTRGRRKRAGRLESSHVTLDRTAPPDRRELRGRSLDIRPIRKRAGALDSRALVACAPVQRPGRLPHRGGGGAFIRRFELLGDGRLSVRARLRWRMPLAAGASSCSAGHARATSGGRASSASPEAGTRHRPISTSSASSLRPATTRTGSCTERRRGRAGPLAARDGIGGQRAPRVVAGDRRASTALRDARRRRRADRRCRALPPHAEVEARPRRGRSARAHRGRAGWRAHRGRLRWSRRAGATARSGAGRHGRGLPVRGPAL